MKLNESIACVPLNSLSNNRDKVNQGVNAFGAGRAALNSSGFLAIV